MLRYLENHPKLVKFVVGVQIALAVMAVIFIFTIYNNIKSNAMSLNELQSNINSIGDLEVPDYNEISEQNEEIKNQSRALLGQIIQELNDEEVEYEAFTQQVSENMAASKANGEAIKARGNQLMEEINQRKAAMSANQDN